MKKIINGKKYNTDTATFIKEYSCDYGVDSLDGYFEELYRKRTGEYFLYGDGGARSPYSKSTSCNSWVGCEDIIPLTNNEAREWGEKHLTCDEFEAEFGEVEE